MIKYHFKLACRSIRRHKLYFVINVIGFALAICVSCVVFLIVNFEFSFDKFHPDRERLYHVGCKLPLDGKWNTSYIPPPAPDAFSKEISGLAAVSKFYPYSATITIAQKGRKPETFDSNIEGLDRSSIIITDKHYFEIFRYVWIAGSPVNSLETPFKVVLTESRAFKYFGATPIDKIIGKQIIYNDSLRVSVSGIVKDWNKNTDFPFTDFISYSTINTSFLKNTYQTDTWRDVRGNPWVWTMVKLSNGVEPEQIENQFHDFLKCTWWRVIPTRI